MSIFGQRAQPPRPANDHLRVADIDTDLDEWAAMREVYEATKGFDEPAQNRIFAAVHQRLADETVVRRHAAEHQRHEEYEHTLDLEAARGL